MKVTLIDGTGFGSPNPSRYAANMIAYTRSTRLNMSPGLLAEIQAKEDYEVLKEMELAAGTIPSSWEFVQFTFVIEGVTRAFTHQLVRTRHASYAQQAMRIVEMTDFEYATGNTIANDRHMQVVYDNAMKNISRTYKDLIKLGAANEDARGVLPTNILTNICMHINMRNFVNLTRKRVSRRVQDEYRNVLDAAIIQVEKTYPWFYLFYKNDAFKARKDLQDMIYENKSLTFEEKTNMVKKLDIIGGQEL
jgi:flavin-dependent thymidylate synthase